MQEKTETKSGSLGGGAVEAGAWWGDGWTLRRAKWGEGHPSSLLLELGTPQGASLGLSFLIMKLETQKASEFP